jgi:hypothetical protein
MNLTMNVTTLASGIELIDGSMLDIISGGDLTSGTTTFFRRDDRSENGPDSIGG